MNRLLGIGLLLCAGASSADEGALEPASLETSARVVVDASGVPRQVEPSAKLPQALRDVVVQRVMQWRFQPVVIDGNPRTGATYVFMDLCAVPQEGGDGLSIAIDYNRNGPGYAGDKAWPAPPVYPADALRAGLQGNFRVVVKVGVDGSATLESVERDKGSLRAFKATLESWVASLRYLPEEIDGVPVATRIEIPVEFAIETDAYAQRARKLREEPQQSPTCKAASQGADRTTPVVLDSPFKPLGSG